MTRASNKFFFFLVVFLSFVDSKRCYRESRDEYVCVSDEDMDIALATKNLTDGGLIQQVEGSGTERDATLDTIRKMGAYLSNLRKTHPDVEEQWFVWMNCVPMCVFGGETAQLTFLPQPFYCSKNTHELCSFWASMDKCESNRYGASNIC